MTRAELIQFINANIYPNGRNQITAPMVRDSILAVVGFLGDAAVKDIGAVLENNTDLVTGGAVYDAIRAYLSSVMKMVGETTTDVITNPTANPVYVDGEPHTAQKGDVVVYGYKEFWWTGSMWKELGDEASWALKTISITGTGDLTGGGTLEANRTLDLTQSAKDKLAHGETAFSWLESYSTNRLRLKSPYSYLNARKGLILEEETDYTNTPADFVKQVVTVGETEYTILRSKLPIVSDSFISAGGISPGGGASGTTLQAVWDSLTTNTGDYANAKIHSGHIPLGSGLGVDGSGNIYVTSQGTVTGIKIGSTTYTPSAGSTIVDISSGIPTSMAWSAITSTPTTLAGYGITDAKIESGVITLGSSTITPLTSHQTIYNLVINNSAGTAQITYKPNVSGTYSLTLTSAMVGLGNVENTALSTWAGTSNITTLGTISTGVWQGTAIGYNYVAAHYIGRTRTTASAAQATLLGIDAISNASSSGSSDASRIVWDSTNNAWHFLGGIYADSFISAGGLSSGGGTSGIDLAAMWASLQNNDNVTTYDSYKIHTNHLPTIAGTGITGTYSTSGTAPSLSTSLSLSVDVATILGYTPVAPSALNDYLPITSTKIAQVSYLNFRNFRAGTTEVSGYVGAGASNSDDIQLSAYSGYRLSLSGDRVTIARGDLYFGSTSYYITGGGQANLATCYVDGSAVLTSGNYSSTLASVYHPKGGSNSLDLTANSLDLSGQIRFAYDDNSSTIGKRYSSSDNNCYNYIKFHQGIDPNNVHGGIEYYGGRDSSGDTSAHRFYVTNATAIALDIRNNGYVGIGKISDCNYTVEVNGSLNATTLYQSGYGVYTTGNLDPVTTNTSQVITGIKTISGFIYFLKEGTTDTPLGYIGHGSAGDNNMQFSNYYGNTNITAANGSVFLQPAGGSVAIGGSGAAPSYTLDMFNSLGRLRYLNFCNVAGTGVTGYVGRGSSANSVQLQAYDGQLGLGGYSQTQMVFGYGTSNIGIGTTDPVGCITLGDVTKFHATATAMLGKAYSTSDTNLYNWMEFSGGSGGITFVSGVWTGGDVDAYRFCGGGGTSDVIFYMASRGQAVFYRQVTIQDNLITTGDQSISSDINKKTHFQDIQLSVQDIANAPAVTFDWKAGGHSFGSIAQYWKPLLGEMVLGEEGNYTLAYAQGAFVNAIINARAIVALQDHETEQDKEIRLLKEKVKKQAGEIRGLRKEIERLNSRSYGME